MHRMGLLLSYKTPNLQRDVEHILSAWVCSNVPSIRLRCTAIFEVPFLPKYLLFISRPDRNFEGTSAIHFLQREVIILKPKHISHHSLHIDFTTIKICHGTREAVSLRKRTNDL